jgi:transcriptional repressor NrdR
MRTQMKCPYCHATDLKVIDSRETNDMTAIRRRRECLSCQQRFTTFETIELTMQVLKRDGRYEDFDKEKLVAGLLLACRHTTISHDQVIALASKITGDLLQRQVRTITTKELGEMVMQHLIDKDTIAYIRFACVYKRFKDVKALYHDLAEISNLDLNGKEET